jgi:hypothetical protein
MNNTNVFVFEEFRQVGRLRKGPRDRFVGSRSQR